MERITHSDNKGWFAFHATAEEAEKLLSAEFHEYEDSVTGGVIPACDQYHLPKDIRQHIDYVSPGVKLLAPPESYKQRDRGLKRDLAQRNSERSMMTHDLIKLRPGLNVSATSLETCDLVITPACIAALYKIPAGRLSSHKNSLGIFESELQFYTQPDLDSFFTRFYPKIPNGTHPVPANIDGGNQTSDLADSGVEAELDLQLAYPIVYPQTTTFYNVDDYLVQLNPNDTYTFGFNTFLDALDGVSLSLPNIMLHNRRLIGWNSRTAISLPMARPEMIQHLIKFILIQPLVVSKDLLLVVHSSLQMLSRSHMEDKKQIFQSTTRRDNVSST